MRLRSIPQSVSNRLASYRASFSRGPAQHFNIWRWLLVTIIIASSGQVKTLTRYMPSRLAYWTTLRMIRAKVWNEMQVTKEERRIQRGVVLPVMAYLLLLRPYGSELEEGQSASLFALKQRFIEEAYQEQFDRTESRFKKKFERLKRAALLTVLLET